MSAVIRPDDEEAREVMNAPSDMALMSAVSKAELDQQITTARAYPRSMKRFVDECREMACLSEDVAAECYFVLPRGGKNIEGPSVRLAEIVQTAWGNCQSGARVIEEGDDFVTAQGVFFDLQRNVKVTMEVRRRITDSKGRRYNADMIGVTGNAACSIALRNAIFRGVPKAFWNDIYEKAREVAAGKVDSLVTNRTKALEWLARKGVTEKMVLDALGIAGIEDLGVTELGTLRGMMTSIKDGTQVETVFAPKHQPEGKPQTEAPKSKSAAAQTKPAEDKPATQAATPIDPKEAVKIEDTANKYGIPINAVMARFEVGALRELTAEQGKAAIEWVKSVNEPKS